MVFLFGSKQDQERIFDNDKRSQVVTRVGLSDCVLLGVKKLNVGTRVRVAWSKCKSLGASVAGQIRKLGVGENYRFINEFVVRSDKLKYFEEDGKAGFICGEVAYKVGDKLDFSKMFMVGDLVKVTATSKGKGFQGVVKRHGFAGGPKTRGQSDRERAPGSIGVENPGRTFKGKRMAGRMGGNKVTIRGLKIVDINKDTMLVSGLLPGFKGGYLQIQSI